MCLLLIRLPPLSIIASAFRSLSEAELSVLALASATALGSVSTSVLTLTLRSLSKFFLALAGYRKFARGLTVYPSHYPLFR